MISLPLLGAWNIAKKVPREAWYVVGLLGLFLGLFLLFRNHYIGVGVDREAHKLIAFKANIETQNTAIIAAQEAKKLADKAAYQFIADNQRIQHEITQKTADAIIADARSGKLRLRDNLRCSTAPRNSSATAGIQPASSGGLSGADEEFLIRYAERADQVATDLNACYARSIQDRIIVDSLSLRESQ